MQVPRRVDLGPKRRLQVRGRLRGENRIVEYTGGMDHGGQRMRRRDPGQHAWPSESRSAASHASIRTEAPRAARSDRISAAPRPLGPVGSQEQVTDAMIGDQMAGEQRPPSTPVPPVISTVPSRSSGSGHGEHELAGVACLVRKRYASGVSRMSHARTGSGRSVPDSNSVHQFAEHLS